jgi:hypothetical protein
MTWRPCSGKSKKRWNWPAFFFTGVTLTIALVTLLGLVVDKLTQEIVF